VVLVVLISAALLAVADVGSSMGVDEAGAKISDDSLFDVVFTVCSLLEADFTVSSPVGALAVAAGTKLGVSSDIVNGHMPGDPDAGAIEMVASGM
jgi:hypothetical protein